MRTGVNLYPPSDPTVVESEALVPSFVSVTVAPPITAPEASVTVPRMLPVSTWAWTGLELNSIMLAAIANDIRRIQDETVFRFMTSSPSFTARVKRFLGFECKRIHPNPHNLSPGSENLSRIKLMSLYYQTRCTLSRIHRSQFWV